VHFNAPAVQYQCAQAIRFGKDAAMQAGTAAFEPEAIIASQLEAYNARDIEAFMAFWHEDAQYFAHPSTLLANGAAEIRARHVGRFEEAALHGRLIGRFSVGNLVVDREVVTRIFPEGPGQVDVIAIYEVEGGKIAKAWFKLGQPSFGGER
jgi:putative hydrolase of HD superfamily